MIECSRSKLILGAICVILAIPLGPSPAEARVHDIVKLVKWLTKRPPVTPPPVRPRGELPTTPRPPAPKPHERLPREGEAEPWWNAELPPEIAAELETAAKQAVERMQADLEAARSGLRSTVEAKWREQHLSGAPEPPSDARVHIRIEAEGLSRGEFDAIHLRMQEVFRESAPRPLADGMRLTEVNFKDAYLELYDPVRQRTYVVGFKLLKRAIEAALVIGASKALGGEELVDRVIECGVEDVEAGDRVCEFLTVVGSVIDLAWWDEIQGQNVPTELVLDSP